jgi:hypothetical protein
MSLDVYPAGRSPGFCGSGLLEEHQAQSDGAEGVIVLYRVFRDVVDKV